MKFRNDRIALLLGLGVNGYGILRSLNRGGINVVGVDIGNGNYAAKSSHLIEVHKINGSASDDEICGKLVELGRRLGAPVVFPTDDRFVSLLETYQDALSTDLAYHWVEPGTIAKVSDKASIDALCRQAKVQVPRTHVTRLGGNLDEAIRDLEFPCIVKPNRAFGTCFPAGMKNYIAKTPAELYEFFSANAGLMGEAIIQEIISGNDDCVYQCTVLVDRAGETVTRFCARKIHQYPPNFGIMCFGRSEWNEDVVAESTKLLRILDYRGIGSLEFKRRPEDGRYFFIEMNPRLPWYNALIADAGTNLPLLAYQDLTGEELFELPVQRNNVYWCSLKEEMGWLSRVGGARRISLFGWARGLFLTRSFAWWNRRDPKPFITASLAFIIQLIKQLPKAITTRG